MSPKVRYCILLVIILGSQVVSAQELPPCGQRDFLSHLTRVSTDYFCNELPIVTDAPTDFTSIVLDENSNLYATHPWRGQLVMVRDTDGDALPDTSTVLADDLARPHGITLYNDDLYIMGDGVVYAYSLREQTLTTLIDNLPSGRGFLARAITVHAEQLYIGIPFPCDFCEGDNPLHGTVLRYDLDGTNQQIIARGLRYPTALHVYQERLWVADSARDAYISNTHYDELNTIDLASDDVAHFGFPYCVGNNIPDLVSDTFDCRTDATAPTIRIQTNATPYSLTTYDSDTVPEFTGHLLVAFFGSADSSEVAGHSLLAVSFEDDMANYHTIAPSDNSAAGAQRWQRALTAPLVMAHSNLLNTRGAGIHSLHLYDAAVSPEGWIYYSVSARGVFVLRQR